MKSNKKIENKLTVFDKITEAIGWIQIVLSPVLLSLLIGVPFYLSNESTFTFIILCLLFLTGLIVGIIYANKIAKKRGTINFLSRISASPELDNKEEK